MPETAVPESVSTERPKKAHARETTIRLLQVLAVAALLFPLLLYGYGSWLSYREAKALAIERIGHSLDVMQEQALKVFQSMNLALDTIDILLANRSSPKSIPSGRIVRTKLPELPPKLPETRLIRPRFKPRQSAR